MPARRSLDPRRSAATERTERTEPGPADGSGDDAESTCSVHESLAHLVQLLPRVMRGLRRSPDGLESAQALRGRHRSALALVRDGDISVGSLAEALGLTLPTTSGLIGDLERAGFVERSVDPANRRRTLVTIAPGRRSCAELWLEGATAPIARVLEQLTSQERSAFVKAMASLDTELARSGLADSPCPNQQAGLSDGPGPAQRAG